MGWVSIVVVCSTTSSVVRTVRTLPQVCLGLPQGGAVRRAILGKPAKGKNKHFLRAQNKGFCLSVFYPLMYPLYKGTLQCRIEDHGRLFFFTQKYAMVALIRVWSLNFYSRKNSNNPLSGHNIKFLFNKIGPNPIKTYQNLYYGL